MATSRPAKTLTSFICQSCRAHLKPRIYSRRLFNTTPQRKANDPDPLESMFGETGVSRGNNRNNQSFGRSQPGSSSTIPSLTDALDAAPRYESLFTEEASRNLDAGLEQKQAHRLHVYATKHNTHITLVQPERPASETASLRMAGSKTSAAEQKKMVTVLISVSAGNIGFKKAGRGSYDAAFQLAAYVLRQMQDKGMTRDIRNLEVVLRGFGAGRDAVPKVLLGTEGRYVRTKITAVIDATRLKQGGPRSKKPRRLG